jgi:hypothetical protein
MESIVEQFRQRVSARQAGGRSVGRYPNDLRQLALTHLAEVRRRGGRASQAARDLGVDANTLRVWEKRSRSPEVDTNTLLPVEVALPRSDGGASPYVVIGPRDIRVECATAEAVAKLFVALS